MVQAAGKTPQEHFRLVGEGLVGALTESAYLAIPLLLVTGFWAYERRGFWLLILSVGGTALEYGFVRGNTQHQGLILIAFVVSLWTLWPTTSQLPQLRRNGYWTHQFLLAWF